MIKLLKSLLYVPKCVACRCTLDDTEHFMCSVCAAKWIYEARPRTSSINSAMGDVPLIYLARYVPFSVTHMLVWQSKRVEITRRSQFLAAELLLALKSEMPLNGAYVTYVPCSAATLRSSGSDQSETLAQALVAEAANEDFDVQLLSLFSNRSSVQQKSLGAEARAENARTKHVIDAKKAANLRGKKVLLIDDVVTSGASMAVCAEQLMGAGAEVTCIAVARAGKDK